MKKSPKHNCALCGHNKSSHNNRSDTFCVGIVKCNTSNIKFFNDTELSPCFCKLQSKYIGKDLTVEEVNRLEIKPTVDKRLNKWPTPIPTYIKLE